jgi:hypothetical protein
MKFVVDSFMVIMIGVYSIQHYVIKFVGDLSMTVQSVFITTKVVTSNPVHGEVYSLQHYHLK